MIDRRARPRESDTRRKRTRAAAFDPARSIAQRAVTEGDATEKQLRPLTTADIKNVMKAYEKFGTEKFIKAFVRNQDIVLNISGKPPEKVLTEYFISMDLLRKPLFVDVEMRGSGRLFNEFTLVLDQILLQAFDQMHVQGGRCSVNLNVESVFTEQFEAFVERTPEAVLKDVVFEFRQSNIVENFDEFQVARGLIKSKGAQIDHAFELRRAGHRRRRNLVLRPRTAHANGYPDVNGECQTENNGGVWKALEHGCLSPGG